MAATQVRAPDQLDHPFPGVPVSVPPSPVDEQEALRISNEIDEDIRKDLEARNKRKGKEIKVMLLGQAESGKSTLQKQFQLHYASTTLEHERPAWRPIVYINVIKAIRTILHELDYRFPLEPAPLTPSPSVDDSGSASPVLDGALAPGAAAELAHLRSKLLPLVAAEDALAAELRGGVQVAGGRAGVFVRAGWQAPPAPLSDIRNLPPGRQVVADIVGKTVAATRGEIAALWRHAVVQGLVRGNKVRLEEYAAFFFESIDRIAEPDYVPSIEDVLHVRLQTIGVKEHAFDINMGPGMDYRCILFDVGGARGQRQAWVPYFEDATAIIFLAPISAFDQYLEEDPRTNRIDDSLQLFTALCSNKLLARASLVLMLNKADLLRQKLAAGVKVRKYISSYGDRPNNYEEVSEYFRAHFIQVHKRKDAYGRPLYMHFTSMIDTKAMRTIIVNVGESILRKHMASIGLA